MAIIAEGSPPLAAESSGAAARARPPSPWPSFVAWQTKPIEREGPGPQRPAQILRRFISRNAACRSSSLARSMFPGGNSAALHCARRTIGQGRVGGPHVCRPAAGPASCAPLLIQISEGHSVGRRRPWPPPSDRAAPGQRQQANQGRTASRPLFGNRSRTARSSTCRAARPEPVLNMIGGWPASQLLVTRHIAARGQDIGGVLPRRGLTAGRPAGT